MRSSAQAGLVVGTGRCRAVRGERFDMPLTKEEFLEAVRMMADDARDEDGSFASMRRDFMEVFDDAKVHDAEMATHVFEIISAFDRLAAYVVSRTES